MKLSNSFFIVYYKSTDLFVLIFDAEKPESLEKLQKCFEDIRNSRVDFDVKAIMVAMHNKKKASLIFFLCSYHFLRKLIFQKQKNSLKIII